MSDNDHQTPPQSTQKSSEPAVNTSGGGNTGDLLESLAQVEAHLRTLKRVQSEHHKADQSLENKHREIQSRIESFEGERDRVHARESELVDRGRELDQQREEVRSRLDEMEQQRRDLERRAGEVENAGSERERQLSRLSEALDKQMNEIDRREGELNELRSTADRVRELQVQLETRGRQIEELTERSRGFEEARGRADALDRQLCTARDEVAHLQGSVTEMKRSCESSEEEARAELEETRRRVEQLGAELEQARELGTQGEASREHAERLERRVRELDAHREQEEVSKSELGSTISRLEQEVVEARASTERFEHSATEFEARVHELEERHAQDQARAESDEASVTGFRSRVEGLEHELHEARQSSGDLEGARAGYESRINELEEQWIESQESCESMRGRVDQLESELGEARQAADGAGSETEQMRSRIGQLESELNEARSRFEGGESQSQTLRDELDRVRDELESSQALCTEVSEKNDELQARASELENGRVDASAFESERAGLTSRVEELQTELSQTNESFESERAGLGSRVVELESQASRAVESFESERASFETQLEELRGQGGNGSCDCGGTIAELESRLASVSQELVEARAMGEQSTLDAGKTQELEAEIHELHEQLDLRGQALEQLATRVKEAEREQGSGVCSKEHEQIRARHEESSKQLGEAECEIESLRVSLSERKSEMGGEWSQNRRARLVIYRGMLRKQSEKVRRASEALRDRYTECEKLLSRRSELSSAYHRFNAERERMVKKEVRSSASLALAGVFGVLAIVAGVSWFVAGQVAPGRFAASASLVADGGRRVLTDGEMEGWQTYVESLVSDPAFLDVASDRMRQRGIASLGSPGGLSQRMKSDLTFQSPGAGRLELELIGDGPVKTERVLDTFVIAMSSHANQSRTRRRDSASTQIVEQASASDRSLDKTRAYVAGGIFVGGFVFAFGVGGMLWKKMASTKTNFERDQKIGSVLDDTGWIDPRQAA